MPSPLCIFCSEALPASSVRPDGEATCPECLRGSKVVLLPAISGTPLPVNPEPTPFPGEGDPVCFYDPSRKATHECSHCGVLISSEWTAHWGSRSLCLKCLDHLRASDTEQGFQRRLVLWDTIALQLALLPLTVILAGFVFVSAPAALFISIWKWNAPRSMASPSRWKMATALLLAALQILAVATMISMRAGVKLEQ